MRTPQLIRHHMILVLASVCLFSAVPVLATQDNPRFKWWQNETSQRKLGLATDQSKRIEEIFQSALPDLRRGKQQLDALENELSRLVESSADDTTVAQQVDRVEAARAVLNKTRTLMLLRIRRILRPDQRIRLDTLHKDRGPEHMDREKRH